MRIDSQEFKAENSSQTREPVFVIEVSFDDANTDLHYFTTKPATGLTGSNVTDNAVRNISSTSQRLSVEKALSTIGSIRFEVLDDAVTTLQRTKLSEQKGLSGKRVRVYQGFPSLPWAEYILIQTQIISQSITFKDGVYTFHCSDVQRQLRKEIFTLKETALTGNLTEDATTINVYNTNGFERVFQPPIDRTVAPGQTVGFIKIEGENDDFEIVYYTGKTGTTFTGCVRGVLGTRPISVTVESGTTEDNAPKVEEYVYLEMPAIKLAYALITGSLYGHAGRFLPDHWHLGVSTDYVKTSDFINIGTDLWDTSDNTAEGLIAVVRGMDDTDGKQFIEEQLFRMAGVFSPIYSTGEMGLKRANRVLSTGGFVRLLDEDNVVKYGNLKHDLKAVINSIVFKWNWDERREAYTRTNILIDPDSIATHGESKPKTIKMRTFHGNWHSYDTIKFHFDTYRDRFAGPPELLTLTLTPENNDLEIGDIVRVQLPQIEDFNGSASSIDRNFEIQQVRHDWKNGDVVVTLFGSSQEASDVDAEETGPVTTSWIGNRGTEINSTNFPSSSVSSTGGVTTVEGPIDLSGHADLDHVDSIFYCLEDLIFSSSSVVTLGQNTQIHVDGNVQINGDVNGAGLGNSGGTGSTIENDPNNDGVPGFVGNLVSGAGLHLVQGANVVGYYTGEDHRPAPVLGTYPDAPRLNIQLDDNGLVGLPSTLVGSSGAAGGRFEYTGGTNQLKAGGDGGASGAGLLVVCEGMSIGANAVIDLSGLDGQPGGGILGDLSDLTTNGPGAASNEDEYHAGSGSGGHPGAFYVLLTNPAGNRPSFDNTNCILEIGESPVAPTQPGKDLVFVPSGYSTSRTFLQGHAVFSTLVGTATQRENLRLSNVRVIDITANSTPVDDVPALVQGVPSFTLTEYTNTPITVDGNRSSIEVSVTPPSDANYSHSEVQYRVQGTQTWTIAPPASNESVFEVASDGTTYEVRIIAVSTRGRASPSGPSQTITTTNVVGRTNAELLALYPLPTVTVALDNTDGGSTVFSGMAPIFYWDSSATELSYFDHFQVEIFGDSDPNQLRTERISGNSFEYTYEKNRTDYNQRIGSEGEYLNITCKVRVVGRYRDSSNAKFRTSESELSVSASLVSDRENLRYYRSTQDSLFADVAQALGDAADAQSTADGKINVFYQASTPTGGESDEGDLWIHTGDQNRTYRYNGTNWLLADDDRIGATVIAAQTAQTTADQKAVVYYDSSAPGAAEPGDLWYNTTDATVQRRNDAGTAWEAFATWGANWLTNISNIPAAAIARSGISDLHSGGFGNLIFTPNQNSAGASDLGEIRVQGDTFYHPDGTKRTGISNASVQTPFEGSNVADPFFIIYTDTDPHTRFTDNNFGNINFFAATYDPNTDTWTAVSNTLATEDFTPVDSDCVVAVGRKWSTSGGIDRLSVLVGSNQNLPEDGAGVNRPQISGNLIYNGACNLLNDVGKPSGLLRVESAGDQSLIEQHNDSQVIVGQGSAGIVAVGFPAFRVNPNTTYTVRIRVRATATHNDGFFCRMLEYDGDMPVNIYHIATNGTVPNTVGENREITLTDGTAGNLENIGLAGTWEEFEAVYTPNSATKWAGITLWRHSSMGSEDLIIDTVLVTDNATVGADWDLNLANRPPESNLLNALQEWDDVQDANGNRPQDGAGVNAPQISGNVIYNGSCNLSNSAGKPSGLMRISDNYDQTYIDFLDSNREQADIGTGVDVSFVVGWPVFRVNPDTTYSIKIRARTNAGVGGGVYIRMLELDTDLSAGNQHLSRTGAPLTGTDEATRQVLIGFENQPIATSWEEIELSYTPTATAKWAQVTLWHWTDLVATSVYIDRVVVFPDADVTNYDDDRVNNNVAVPFTLVNGTAFTETYGSRIEKVSGGANSWDAGVYSAEAYTGGCFMSCVVDANTDVIMIGLSDNPGAAQNYNDINHCFYIRGTAQTVRVYENASHITAAGEPAISAGDVLSIVYNNVDVIYYINGVEQYRTAGVGAGLAFHLDSSFHTIGSSVSSVNFGPVSPSDWASIGGPNRPEDNATLGATWGTNLSNIPAAQLARAALGDMNTGGFGNLYFVKDTDSAGGNTNIGEIYAFGDTFYHPDGTKRSYTAGMIVTPYENTITQDPFFIVWSDEDPNTRFASMSSQHGHFFAAIYDLENDQWSAVNNGGTLDNFEPLTSDCIVAVGRKWSTSGGIDRLASLVATNQNLPADGADVTDYLDNRINNNQATPFTLVPANSDIEANGTRIERVSDSTGLEAGVYSVESYTGGCFLSFVIDDASASGNIGVGFNDDPDNFNIPQDMEFWVQIVGATQVLNVNDTGTTLSSNHPIADGDVIHLVYNNVDTIVYQNGVELYREPSFYGANRKYYFDASFQTGVGKSISSVNFGPLSPSDWANIGGPNRPADNATVGAIWGGNIDGQPDNSLVLNNLISTTDWTAGDTGPSDNVSHITSSSNVSREVAADAYGLDAVLWKSTNNDGMSITLDGLDPSKSYRFSTWVYKRSSCSVLLRAYGANKVRDINSGSLMPSFASFINTSSTPTEGWYLFIGYIWSRDSQRTTDSLLGGIYDPETGQRLTWAHDFKWDTNTTDIEFRIYASGQGVGTLDYLYFSKPRFQALGVDNIAQDFELPVPLRLTNNATAGLNLTSTHLGYYDGSAWQSYMGNDGTFYLNGDASNYLQWDGTTMTVRGDIQASSIAAGAIDGETITGTTITGSTITGGTLRTASSGERTEIRDSDNKLHSYWDSGDGTVRENVTLGTTEDANNAGDYYAMVVGGPSYRDFGILLEGDPAYHRNGIHLLNASFSVDANTGQPALNLDNSGSGYVISAVASGSGDAIYAESTSYGSTAIYAFGERGGISATATDAALGAAVTANGVIRGVTATASGGRGVNSSGSTYDFYASGAGTNYGPFTGAHDALIDKSYQGYEPGDIVKALGVACRSSLSNVLIEIAPQSTPEVKNSFGVLAWSSELRDDVAAMSELSESEVNAFKSSHYLAAVNGVGEGQLNVCDEGGDIEIGDFIITSTVQGKGKVYHGDNMRLVVARALEAVDWSQESESVKQIACIYMCG